MSIKVVRDLGKLIVAKGFKKLPNVQKIAQSGHTASDIGFTAKRSKYSYYDPNNLNTFYYTVVSQFTKS